MMRLASEVEELRERRGNINTHDSLLNSLQTSPSIQSLQSVQSLQSRLTFATAKRDRLQREVAELTRACAAERAEQQTLIQSRTNLNVHRHSHVNSNAFAAINTREREWVKRARIANTLRAQLYTQNASISSV
ncbi:hypothetical protein LSM04_007769 [Trypanosoma melophagium]|uniref:uncharacterized protein n=1 Tax=Trypanosoma melophagium TaxID=715481 RepID=UPI00351A3544|nr:hypothetical protein LSM04_007769 [Trypanosoma melophagium]